MYVILIKSLLGDTEFMCVSVIESLKTVKYLHRKNTPQKYRLQLLITVINNPKRGKFYFASSLQKCQSMVTCFVALSVAVYDGRQRMQWRGLKVLTSGQVGKIRREREGRRDRDGERDRERRGQEEAKKKELGVRQLLPGQASNGPLVLTSSYSFYHLPIVH